jgi:superoxide dismutase, Cu-Zn family
MSSSKKISKVSGISILHQNKKNIEGTIEFEELEGERVKVKYEVKGLVDGKHGFHIHDYGDLSDGCMSACSHFNPFNKNHGGLKSKERHSGDLGNIVSKNKISRGELIASGLSLSKKKTNILGRMIIIHENEDDLGRGSGELREESLKTGNAGSRVACGVIGIASKKCK